MITLDVYICQENISLYKKLLSSNHISGGRRDVISKMLAEEEAKLLALFAINRRVAFNDWPVARTNIDHYLGLLYDVDLAPEKRAMVTKKLIQEEDNLAHDFEQLEFAEKRAADGRDRLNNLRNRLDLTPKKFRAGTERLVFNVEAIQHLLEGFCRQLRDRANDRH